MYFPMILEDSLMTRYYQIYLHYIRQEKLLKLEKSEKKLLKMNCQIF